MRHVPPIGTFRVPSHITIPVNDLFNLTFFMVFIVRQRADFAGFYLYTSPRGPIAITSIELSAK
jgi:hypothetical protein